MRKHVYSILILLLVLMVSGGCIVGVTTAPVIVTFEALPSNISSGGTATLVWSVTGANTVSIEPNIGEVAASGSRQVSPGNTTAYTLTARNNLGGTAQSVVINVEIPQVTINTFNASPSTINAGQSSTISWQVSGATNVTITPNIGSVALSGSRSVSPSDTTTYTLTATAGAQQRTATVAVTVNSPPIISNFFASPENIEYGRTSLLRWNVSGANSVRIEPDVGPVPSAGNYAVTPTSTTTYVLVAESECCVVSESVVVRVDAGFPSPYIPTVNLFNVQPNSIYAGGSANLQWSVSGADQVYIDHGIGQVGSSGSVNVSPSSSTTYTLTATNSYGYRTVSVGIVVFEL